MAKTVTSVSLTQPTSDPNLNEGQTFTMGGQVTLSNHGGGDYNMIWQWDQGTSTWVNIPSSGAALTTPTNTLSNLGDELEHTQTITCNTAGTYAVRIRVIDNNNGGAATNSSSQTITVNAVSATLDQTGFRFRDTDGSETTATWLATENTSINHSTDVPVRLRFVVQETGGSGITFTPTLYRSHSSGTYTRVDGASSIARSIGSPNISNGTATTDQLGGTGTFKAGEFDESDGQAAAITLAASEHTEVEFCFWIRPQEVADLDTIDFRVYDGSTALDAYTQTPRITVDEPVLDQHSFRFINDDGSESAATFKAALNTDITLQAETTVRLRFLVKCATANGAVDALSLQRRLNSGSWGGVTNASSVAQLVLSSNITDLENSTQRLGSGTFATGYVMENDWQGKKITFAGNDETEVEFVIKIVDADTVDTDVIEFRLARQESFQILNTITQTPSITVGTPAASYSITGNVTADVTPAAIMTAHFDFSVVGNVMVTLSPDGIEQYNQHLNLTGSVPLDITPLSTFVKNIHPSLSGNIPLTLSAEGIFDFNIHPSIDGNVTSQFEAASVMDVQIHPSIDGTVSVTLTPQSGMSAFGAYSIAGNVDLELTPQAGMLMNRHPEIAGDITLALAVSSVLEQNKHPWVDGDVAAVLSANSPMDYSAGQSSFVLVGNVPLVVTPNAVMVLSGPTVPGPFWNTDIDLLLLFENGMN